MSRRTRVGIVLLVCSLVCGAEAFAADENSDRRPFSAFLELNTGVEYDSNLSVDDLDIDADSGDWAALLGGKVGLEYTFGSGTAIRLDYDLSQSLHHESDEFDLRSHLASVDLSQKLGKAKVGISYQHLDAALDNDSFLVSDRFSPHLSTFIGRSLFLRTSYGYSEKTFDEISDRDADVHSGSADIFLFWNGSPRTYLTTGYGFAREDARADEFDFDGHNIKVRAVKRFRIAEGRDTKLSLGWKYERRDYAEVTPSIAAVRDDERHKLQLKYDVQWTSWLTTSLKYEYRDYTSNLPSADYAASVASLRFRFRIGT